jgi:hypothetical protein
MNQNNKSMIKHRQRSHGVPGGRVAETSRMGRGRGDETLIKIDISITRIRSFVDDFIGKQHILCVNPNNLSGKLVFAGH